MKKRYILMSLVLISFLFLISCGGSGSVSAPADAAITISPSTFTLTDGTSVTQEHIQEFLIVVKDENGIPLKDVDLRIQYIWAIPDPSELVQLLDTNSPANSPYHATTDENGSYISRLQFKSGGGLSYRADLQVTSGSLFKSATLEVKAAAAE